MVFVSEKALLATKRNGALGRRSHLSKRILEADEARKMIQRLLAVHGPAIMDKAAEQALEGDRDARVFLYERAYGKAPQSIEVNSTVEHKYSGQVNVAVLTAEVADKLKASKLA